MENGLKLAYGTELLLRGILRYVIWDYGKFPHLLVLGNTGSGKTYFIRLLLGRVSLIPDSRIWLCDYKGQDFRGFAVEGMRCWGYKNVLNGFSAFCAEFERRLQEPQEVFSVGFLLIDEYVSWIASMEKKEAEEIKKKMASLLFMARALNLHVILGCQRAMAESFPYGSRDCLNVVFLGSPSRESIHSFCAAEESAAIKPCGQGSGYVLFDGKPPKEITVPTIRNVENLNNIIKSALTR
jgi:hypothetical protein